MSSLSEFGSLIGNRPIQLRNQTIFPTKTEAAYRGDLILLAMVHFRQGDASQANRDLNEVREIDFGDDAGSRALLAEAEALIDGPVSAPRP